MRGDGFFDAHPTSLIWEYIMPCSASDDQPGTPPDLRRKYRPFATLALGMEMSVQVVGG
ncbi:MAG TPA: hypothetical protein VI411_04355 [Actinomycetota bacterium]|jgi:hypothetical protein